MKGLPRRTDRANRPRNQRFLVQLGIGFSLVGALLLLLGFLLHFGSSTAASRSRRAVEAASAQEALGTIGHRIRAAELARLAFRATGDPAFAEAGAAELAAASDRLVQLRQTAAAPHVAAALPGPMLDGLRNYLQSARADLESPGPGGVGADDPIARNYAETAAALDAFAAGRRPEETDGAEAIAPLATAARWAPYAIAPLGLLLLAGLFLRVLRYHRSRRSYESELAQARDAALESVRLKAMFLANVSHELRTPMNGVIGMSGMLLETQLDGRQREFTETIRSCAMGLLSIVNDLLDFAKMEAGKVRFEHRDFDLQTTLESAVRFFSEQARRKDVVLDLTVSRLVLTTLRGDPGRLRQIISNLLNNALKFTPSGSIRVEVDRLSEDSREVELRFRITDTGEGMTEETQRNLFQPFHQANDPDSRKKGGTGLGLAICKLLVEQMGGGIQIRSTPGQGTTVEFTARFARGVKVEDLEVPILQLDGEGMILAISPSTTGRRALGRILENWNIRWEGSATAETAVAWLEGAPPPQPIKIVLIEEEPPGSGLRSLETLRKSPALAAARTVLLAAPDKSRRAAENRTRFFAVIERPLHQSDLFDCIASAWSASPNATYPQEATNPALLEPLPTGGRILVAEDNPVNLKVLLHHLSRFGLTPDHVTDGAQAVDAYRRTHYSVILMDCRMPVMDGYEAARIIRTERGPTPPPAIIAVTAHAMQGDAEKCFDSGMDDYLAKPIDAPRLHAKLARWLHHPETAAPPAARPAPISALAPAESAEPIAASAALQPPASFPSASPAPPQLPGKTGPLPARPPASLPAASSHLPSSPPIAHLSSLPPLPMSTRRERGGAEPTLHPIARPIAERIAPPPPSALTPVDFDQFDSVLPSDPDERKEFLTFAWEELEAQKTTLFRLFSNGDPETVRGAAHKLKGAAASLGLRAVAEALAFIERSPSEGASHGAELDRLWNESKSALDAPEPAA